LIFDIKHPWDKEIQICTNEVPVLALPQGDIFLYKLIYIHVAKSLENLCSNNVPIGSQMALPLKGPKKGTFFLNLLLVNQ